jgi:hypothetical protein
MKHTIWLFSIGMLAVSPVQSEPVKVPLAPNGIEFPSDYPTGG